GHQTAAVRGGERPPEPKATIRAGGKSPAEGTSGPRAVGEDPPAGGTTGWVVVVVRPGVVVVGAADPDGATGTPGTIAGPLVTMLPSVLKLGSGTRGPCGITLG